MKYTSLDNTPLKFHKFVFYVLLPLRFITGLYNMINTGSGISFVLYIGALGLITASFIGFFSWKKYSWYTIMIYAGYELGMNLMVAGGELVSGSVSFAYVIGQITVGAGLSIAMLIYYAHRKALFMPEIIPQSIPQQPVTQYNVQYQPQPQASGSDFRFCPQCGAELESDSAFCHKCGAKLR